MVASITLKYTYISLFNKNHSIGKGNVFSSDFCDPMQIFQRAVTCKNCFSHESKAYNLFKAKISSFIVK